jgi:hypothetical protein
MTVALDRPEWPAAPAGAPTTEGLMGTYRYGDLRDETYVLRSVLHAEAGTFGARGPALREARPRRRGARVWLGSFLLAAGQRLLASVPAPRAPA